MTSFHSFTFSPHSKLYKFPTTAPALQVLTAEIIQLGLPKLNSFLPFNLVSDTGNTSNPVSSNILPSHLRLNSPLSFNFVSDTGNTSNPVSSNFLQSHSRFAGSLQPYLSMQPNFINLFRNIFMMVRVLSPTLLGHVYTSFRTYGGDILTPLRGVSKINNLMHKQLKPKDYIVTLNSLLNLTQKLSR